MPGFSHTAVVDAPPAQVYAHLADPRSYVGLSPLVVTVRDVRSVGAAVAYVAVERFRLGPLHWDNPIQVTMTGEPDRKLVSTVVSPGRVRLTATVTLAPAGGGTSVTEHIEIRAPWFLRRFATGQARKVQRYRLAELGRRMAAAGQ